MSTIINISDWWVYFYFYSVHFDKYITYLNNFLTNLVYIHEYLQIYKYIPESGIWNPDCWKFAFSMFVPYTSTYLIHVFNIFCREKLHFNAALALADNDILKACQYWQEILIDHPKDILALHWLFFSHMTTGRRKYLRNSVYRVIHNYKPDHRYYGYVLSTYLLNLPIVDLIFPIVDKLWIILGVFFFRNVHGKLCFGYEENRQFDLATKEGILALSRTPKDVWAIHSVAHIYDETDRYKISYEIYSKYFQYYQKCFYTFR